MASIHQTRDSRGHNPGCPLLASHLLPTRTAAMPIFTATALRGRCRVSWQAAPMSRGQRVGAKRWRWHGVQRTAGPRHPESEGYWLLVKAKPALAPPAVWEWYPGWYQEGLVSPWGAGRCVPFSPDPVVAGLSKPQQHAGGASRRSTDQSQQSSCTPPSPFLNE